MAYPATSHKDVDDNNTWRFVGLMIFLTAMFCVTNYSILSKIEATACKCNCQVEPE